jgi:hypothetical protein
VDGRKWTTAGSVKEGNGKEYLTRAMLELSADGKSRNELFECSADDGRTWKKGWENRLIKVRNSRQP